MNGNYSPSLFGVQSGGLRESRVRAIHVKAARKAIAEIRERTPVSSKATVKERDTAATAEAETVATAVLTAEDKILTDWIVSVRVDENRTYRFGPYRTFKAAVAASERPLPFGGRVQVHPLIPHPKLPKGKP